MPRMGWGELTAWPEKGLISRFFFSCRHIHQIRRGVNQGQGCKLALRLPVAIHYSRPRVSLSLSLFLLGIYNFIFLLTTYAFSFSLVFIKLNFVSACIIFIINENAQMIRRTFWTHIQGSLRLHIAHTYIHKYICTSQLYNIHIITGYVSFTSILFRTCHISHL